MPRPARNLQDMCSFEFTLVINLEIEVRPLTAVIRQQLGEGKLQQLLVLVHARPFAQILHQRQQPNRSGTARTRMRIGH